MRGVFIFSSDPAQDRSRKVAIAVEWTLPFSTDLLFAATFHSDVPFEIFTRCDIGHFCNTSSPADFINAAASSTSPVVEERQNGATLQPTANKQLAGSTKPVGLETSTARGMTDARIVLALPINPNVERHGYRDADCCDR